MMKLLLCFLFSLTINYNLANSAAEKQLNIYIDSVFIANDMTYDEAENILFSFNKRVNSMDDFNQYVQRKLKKSKVFNVTKFQEKSDLKDVAVITQKLTSNLGEVLYDLIKTNDLWHEETFITRLNLLHNELYYWNFIPYRPIEIHNRISALRSPSVHDKLVNKIYLIYYMQKLVFNNTYVKQSELVKLKLDNIKVKYVYSQKKDSNINNEIVDSIGIDQEDPIFPGGNTLMMQFIASNFIFPEIARELALSGTLNIQFVINTDGTIVSVYGIREKDHISDVLYQEGVRVISMMPRWKCGYQDNKAVKVRYVIPIKCSIG